jgi:hypothetical protein
MSEFLKQLAEELGYEAFISDKNNASIKTYQISTTDGANSVYGYTFNPYKNAEQREEVLLWLLKLDWDICEENERFVLWRPTSQRGWQVTVREESYPDALMEAAKRELNDLPK